MLLFRWLRRNDRNRVIKVTRMCLTEEEGQLDHTEQIKGRTFISEVIFILSVCFNIHTQRRQNAPNGWFLPI